MDKQLFTYYNISECLNIDKVFKKLNDYSNDGKIEYTKLDTDTFKIVELDITDDDTEYLVDFFEKMDLIPDMDKCDIDEDSDIEGFDLDEDSDY